MDWGVLKPSGDSKVPSCRLEPKGRTPSLSGNSNGTGNSNHDNTGNKNNNSQGNSDNHNYINKDTSKNTDAQTAKTSATIAKAMVVTGPPDPGNLLPAELSAWVQVAPLRRLPVRML